MAKHRSEAFARVSVGVIVCGGILVSASTLLSLENLFYDTKPFIARTNTPTALKNCNNTKVVMSTNHGEGEAEYRVITKKSWCTFSYCPLNIP